ncbi:MAG: Rne/Rng family ribonuclease [Actinomycetota bacterium]
MKKARNELLVTCLKGKCRLALLEDGEVVEVYIEKSRRKSVVGNIYIGRITSVLPGMSAAFVDIGVGKNALLYLQDLVFMEDGSHVKPRKISKVLKASDTIVVQVTKDPMGSKGARLTTYLSLPGRMMVYMPQSRRSGVSRKLPEKERERLRKIAREVRPEHGSTIIRTAAARARKKDLEEDLTYLVEQWEKTQRRINGGAKPPTLVYQEPDLAVKVVRDTVTREFKSVLVDSRSEYDRIKNYLSTASPELKDRVQLYKDSQPMFSRYGVDQAIQAALRRKVPLPSGGHIVIDEVEAMTAIDVNTGSYTGKKSLEDTVLKTNMEAAVEVVKQLRLRDIGGIIVIDFIDMENPDNKKKVLDILEHELEKDRTKTQVVTLSPLGLVEMTRKNVTEGLAETLGKTCPRCEGRGLVFEEEKRDEGKAPSVKASSGRAPSGRGSGRAPSGRESSVKVTSGSESSGNAPSAREPSGGESSGNAPSGGESSVKDR